MSASVPKDVREKIRQALWESADNLNWVSLADSDKANWYGIWSKNADFGGVLAHYMDPRRVRVYIKDSLLKPYAREKLEQSADSIFGLIGLSEGDTQSAKAFQKPLGYLLEDGRMIAWGSSRDWKSILISVFERAKKCAGASPYAVVLFEAGRTVDPLIRALIEDVAQRLEIERLVWRD